MDKNNLLLLSEVIYQISSCSSPSDLEHTLFQHIGLLIPFDCASFIHVDEDPQTGKQRHRLLFCTPQSFASVEREWLNHLDHAATTIWLSSSTESQVIRDSELFDSGQHRQRMPAYQLPGYQRIQLADALQMNVVRDGKTTDRIFLYRTQAQGLFSELDAFNLRLLSKHINLAVCRCRNQAALPQDLSALTADCGLTRREAEVLDCIFQGMDNAAICDALKISKNTLYKHNNSIFQKCGVRSRWDLLRLRQ